MRLYICSNSGLSLTVTNHVPNVIVTNEGVIFSAIPESNERNRGYKGIQVPKAIFPQIPSGKILTLDINI